MQLYAYCFMPSHVHMIFRSRDGHPMELLRDFKKHTAKQLIAAIKSNPQESRKEWLLKLMEQAGKESGNVSTYKFWQHHNHPKELYSDKVIKQKMDYIHDNPVLLGLVTDSVHYKYSSARNFENDHTILQIDDSGY